MKQVFFNSALWRLITRLREWYALGAVAAFFNAFKQSYPYSGTKKRWDRFVWTPMFRADGCVYSRLLLKLGAAARCVGGWIQQSSSYLLGARIMPKLLNFLGGGIIGRVCRFFGFRGLLIAAVALYLPLDYILRDVLQIGFLASIWDEGLMALCFFYVCWRKAMGRSSLESRATPLDSYLLLFIAVTFFLMCAISPYPSVALDGFRAVVQYLFWFFLMIRLIENDHDFAIFYGALVIMAVLIGLHGIYQFIVAAPIPAAWVSQTEASVRTRVYSITGSPNIMGSFLVLFAPLVAGLAYYAKQTWIKFAAICATGVMCLSIIFTFSKGAWGGLAVAVIIFAVFLDRRLIVLMLAGGAGALLCIPSIASRITYMFTLDYAEASARAGRSIRWATGLQLLHANDSVLGFGLGRFGGAVAMQNKLIEETDTFQYFYMDNYYLKTLVEMGYLGLLFFIILLIGMICWCLRGVGRTRTMKAHPLAVGMFSGMLGVLTHCFFENIFEVPYMMAYFWTLAAAILYLGYFRQKIPKKTLD